MKKGKRREVNRKDGGKHGQAEEEEREVSWKGKRRGGG